MQRSVFYFCLSLFGAFFLFQSNAIAQTITKSYHFPSLEIFQYEENGKQVKRLTFDGAITTSPFITLPALCDKMEVNHFYNSYTITLSNVKYSSLTSEETALVPADYAFVDPEVKISSASDANKFFATWTIIPFIKNTNGQYQRLVSCDIRFEGQDPIALSRKSGAKNSVLATGDWYKISVNSTGLHKVTYNDLKNLGAPVSNLRSSSISIFGNGGGMIHDINPIEQIDDLMECPIMIVDNSGVFNENSYFIFYAQGPHTWDFQTPTEKFTHNYNIYSDDAFYFINVDAGIGEKKRISTKDYRSYTENGTITTFTHYDFYEKDVINFGESGREWFDESFSNSYPKTFNFTLPELFNNTARVTIRLAATSTAPSNLKMTWGNNEKNFTVKQVSSSAYAVDTILENNNLPFSSGNVELALTYTSSQTSMPAYLDYIELQAKCNLKINSDAMPFAITENIGAGNISLLKVSNASAQTKVWDVTDHNAVYQLAGDLSGTQFSFKTPTDQPRRFVAFNGASYKPVTTVGKIANQNLHGFGNVDMIIVSHTDFLAEANRLAKFRAEQNNIKVKVVTPQQVYNEFSSGAQDIGAIRNFMRYLYDSHSQALKYLLLFGRPSYDYRERVAGTQLFVPNYQGNNSLSENSFRSFDDYFGVLGIHGSNLVNVAVGRFPVANDAEAIIAVDKTINASVRAKVALQNTSQISNFGDWRNMIALVADDKDYDALLHFDDAETVAGIVNSNNPAFNFDKIYCDAYPSVSYAGGKRFPDVNKALNMRMQRGALVIAYFGHGGENGWSHERILEVSDIINWSNKYNQPIMVTITCSFGWYDKQAISPAEKAFLNDKGGVCAAITTSRVSYSNNKYGRELFDEMGSKWNNRYKTIGEIHRFAKNNCGGITDDNSNMIYLMGDPAMTLNIPNHKVKTLEILGENQQQLDTLKALSKITVKGEIIDDEGKTITHFNGNIFPSIYDKTATQKTLGTLPIHIKEFSVQKNIIFKGNATVVNGRFEFSFFVPKDINFEYGSGKISYYAASDNDDAGDFYDNFIVGGMSDNPITDNEGPEISVFMNDEKFVPGGITNPNPILFLKLKDEYGINTTGNGIGHDLVAILDNHIEKQMILNDYYVADQDCYNSGTVRYPLLNLEPGMHTIKVRAWDISNNPSEATIDFVVKTEDKLLLDHVLNYPNPFTTKTSFFFEHNQPGEQFDILLHIYTVSGKLVKTIQTNQFLEGNRSYPIDWNGRDEYGDKIGKGVYVYRLKVRNSQGETAEKIEKIAIL